MANIHSPTVDTVAIIGLGQMGLPMARCLCAAGYELHGFDVSKAACEAFSAAGGRTFPTVSAAVERAQLIITMLPDGNIVRKAVLVADGIAESMQNGALLVDMSSSAPLDTRDLGNELERRGIRFMDAPVSGGIKKAVEGALTIMVGGKADDLNFARQALQAMGTTIVHTGALGSGHAMKALNNYVSAAGLSAACEALLIGQAFGINPHVMVDVLNTSTGRNNSTEVKLKPHILSGSFGSGFSMALMSKDLRTAMELGHKLEIPAKGLDQEFELWSRALESLNDRSDHTEIYRYLQMETRSTV